MERRGLDAGHLATAFSDASPELLRLILDAVPVGVFVVGGDGRIKLANSAAADLFKWEQEELLGLTIEEMIPEDARSQHRDHRAEYARHPSVRPIGRGRLLRGRRSDGSTFIVEVSLSPLVLGEELHVLVCVRDITARVTAEEVRRREEAWKAVLDDRIRIARDLHDTVIQELFASGLTIANLSSGAEGSIEEALNDIVHRLDDIIRHVRQTVFRLHTLHGPEDDLGRIAKEATRVLGFEPELDVTGDPNHLPATLRSEVGSVVRESLANVARHARAGWARVSVEIGEEGVTVAVADDGVGLSNQHEAGTGLRSMKERAEARGGTARFEAQPDGGTLVVWRVPIVSGYPESP